MPTDRKQIATALAVTCELTGTVLSAPALAAAVEDLLPFGATMVLAALRRCRQEVRGHLTVADVLNRIDDGRPSVDVAWSLIPIDESETVVWTEEMAAAYGVAHRLLRAGDHVGARLAFGREYERLVRAARASRTLVAWRPSLGYDPATRTEVIEQAHRTGRLALHGTDGVLSILDRREE